MILRGTIVFLLLAQALTCSGENEFAVNSGNEEGSEQESNPVQNKGSTSEGKDVEATNEQTNDESSNGDELKRNKLTDQVDGLKDGLGLFKEKNVELSLSKHIGKSKGISKAAEKPKMMKPVENYVEEDYEDGEEHDEDDFDSILAKLLEAKLVKKRKKLDKKLLKKEILKEILLKKMGKKFSVGKSKSISKSKKRPHKKGYGRPKNYDYDYDDDDYDDDYSEEYDDDDDDDYYEPGYIGHGNYDPYHKPSGKYPPPKYGKPRKYMVSHPGKHGIHIKYKPKPIHTYNPYVDDYDKGHQKGYPKYIPACKSHYDAKKEDYGKKLEQMVKTLEKMETYKKDGCHCDKKEEKKSHTDSYGKGKSEYEEKLKSLVSALTEKAEEKAYQAKGQSKGYEAPKAHSSTIIYQSKKPEVKMSYSTAGQETKGQHREYGKVSQEKQAHPAYSHKTRSAIYYSERK